MNYLDVYFSRINHLGETTAERIRNGGIRSFEKWMAESPHTIRNLSVERGIYFDGIILTSKDKEYEKIMFLEVALDIPIKVGDIMNWVLDDGSVEKWLLIQEEKKVNGTFRSFWIVRCNYFIRWIDSQGHLQSSWAYFVSSLDSKIKGNFRTWNNLITPQPNKYAEILMPRYPIDRATNFIVEDESWTVVEYDHSSVPGVIYLSLTESKVNGIYDDTINQIADLDKLAVYELSVPEVTQAFLVNEPIELTFTLTKNGVPSNEEVEFISSDKKIAKNVDGQLIAVAEGVVDIIVQLKEYPAIQKIISIKVDSVKNEFSAYIEGSNTLRLDRVGNYLLKGTEDISGEVIFSIDDTTLAKISKVENNQCEVHANSKNKLGKVVLSASYNNVTYTKEISIIPLW
jgi:hypothetical protein